MPALELPGSPAAPAAAAAVEVKHEAQLNAEFERRLVETREQIEREVLARDADMRARFEHAEKQRAAEHAQRVGVLDQIVQGVSRAHEARLRHIERDAIELAFAALCRVLGPQPERERLLADLVERGMHRLKGQPVMTIRMNPEDLAVLSASGAWHDLCQRHPGIQWRADPSLLRGSCDFDSERGTLEAGLQTQLSELAKRWAEADGGGRDAAATAVVAAEAGRQV